MDTTLIQLRKKTAARLRNMKHYPRQTYDDVINRILDNPDDLTVDDIAEIKAGMEDIRTGRFVTRRELEKGLGIKP